MENIIEKAFRSSASSDKLFQRPKQKPMDFSTLTYSVWLLIAVLLVMFSMFWHKEYGNKPVKQHWEMYGEPANIKRSNTDCFIVSSFTDSDGDHYRVKYQSSEGVWKDQVFFKEEIVLLKIVNGKN